MLSVPSPSPSRLAIAAVIWDYDGTLVDTRAADEAAVAELIRSDPATAAGAELFWAAEGRPITERLELAWPGRLAEILPLFDRPERPRIFPGVTPAIRALSRRGLAQAVVSSRRTRPLEWGLGACELRPAFRAVVGLESVSLPKPDPEGLIRVCAQLGISTDQAVYIGDRDVDVEAGLRAGMTTWRATWSLPRTRSAPGPLEVRRPREVVERIDALQRRTLAAAG
jgi:HAD superfamily hydrolase (TIGR01509 family)